MIVQHMLPIAKYDLGKVGKETRYSKKVYVYARLKILQSVFFKVR